MKLALLLTVLGSFSMAATYAKVVVCYYPNWAYYRSGNGKYLVEDIDPYQCTHLVYAFATLDATSYTMKVYDSWLDISLGNYAKFTQLKAKNPRLKTLIALGGWNDSQGTKYSQLVSDPKKISNFVTQAVSFLEEYHFDGLDLDWEYPNSASDKLGFTNWVKALSDAFKPRGLLLTIAATASPYQVDSGYDVPGIAPYVDLVNLMTYDMHGSWEAKADHHAPLYKRSFEADGNNVDYSVKHWIRRGLPSGKLVLGIPVYGRSFKLSTSTVTPPAPASGAGTQGAQTGEAGFLAFYEVCASVKSSGWTNVRDANLLMGPYAYGGGNWVGYDDLEMARVKTEYAVANGLAGAMVWDLSLDDFRNSCGFGTRSFLAAINSVLSGTTSNTTTTTASYNPTATATSKPTAATTTTAAAAITTTARNKKTTTPSATTTTRAATTTTTTQAATTTTTRTAATTTKAASTGEIVCSYEGQFVPDPNNCQQYYRCADGTPRLFVCPAGTVFSPASNVCDWPYNVPSCS